MSVNDGQQSKSFADGAWLALLDLVFPPHCVACGARGAWFCDRCRETVSASPPIRSRLESGLEVISLSPHRYPMQRIVHALKYEGARIVAPLAAQIMAEACDTLGLSFDLVVPVPLHRARVRRRGYNQAGLLAAALATETGIPVAIDLLERTRDTQSQVGLSRAQRQANVHTAFRSTGRVQAGRVLLIDDVCTSGATLQDCARALATAGAGHIEALTLTRAGTVDIPK